MSTARLAGIFYLATFVTGISAMVLARRNGVYEDAANIVAAVCYIGVTLLFYQIFKPVNRTVSLIAALFGLTGCTVGILNTLAITAIPVNSLVFFGFYCVLIGFLILQSPFLPHILGVLMVIAGLCWLTFVWPPLAKSLSPFIFLPGVIGEGALTVWLLAKGISRTTS